MISRQGSLICDVFTFGFALWTMSCHTATLSGWSFSDLLLLSTAVFAFTLCLIARKRRIHRDSIQSVRDSCVQRCSFPRRDFQLRLFRRILFLAVFLTLIAHRPDEDDSFYVNLAVAAVDSPHEAILARDTLHLTAENIPIFTPVKTHSIEMAAAAMSFMTGIPPIYIFHMFFPILAAVLTISAYGKLFRILAPQRWAYGVLAVFVFLCANGDVHASYGNLSFVRLHQGKGILVSAAIPLILCYALGLASRPTVKNWLLLNCAQISAVGMSATALWVAPSLTAFAVFAGLPALSRKALARRMLLGLSSSFYLILLGLFLRSAYPLPPALSSPSKYSSFALLQRSIGYVFGFAPFGVFCLLIVLCAWRFCDTRLTRRFCLTFPLGLACCFANPAIASLVATRITGVTTYWRIFWLLPMPAIAGLFFLTPLSSPPFHRFGKSVQYALYAFALTGLLIVFPTHAIFSPGNNVRLGLPGLKVPQSFEVAEQLNQLTNARPNVLLAESVSAWITTLPQHPYPLLGRSIYAKIYKEEGLRRLALMDYVSGKKRVENAPQALQHALQDYRIGAVCFPQTNRWREEIRQALKASNFSVRHALHQYEIWMPHSHADRHL